MARQQQCLHSWSVVVMDYGSSTAVFTCMVSDGNGLACQQQCLHVRSVMVMDYGASTAMFTCMVIDGNGLWLVNSNVYMYGQ